MTIYPYTNTPGSLKKFLGIIQSTGIPQKLTIKTLESLGFKSTNDGGIVTILKFINFIGEDGIPTDFWKNYRNKERGPSILAQAICKAYIDLFTVYPDAYRKDNEALRNFLSAHTSVGEKALSAMVTTFKSLCELASFDATNPTMETNSNFIDPAPITNTETDADQKSTNSSIPIISSLPQQKGHGLSVNINIELHLPATQDGDIYNKLFEALKHHLLQG